MKRKHIFIFEALILLAICAARTNSQEDKSGAVQQKVETPMATDERLERQGWWPTKGTASRDEFVGTRECSRCHTKITASQLQTPMARAASLTADSDMLHQHLQVSNTVGPYTYSLASGTAPLYSVTDGAHSASATIGWAFGLGNKGQTYVYQRDGLYYESRVSYYKSLQTLDLTTGHAAEAPKILDDALGRVLDARSAKHCFGCHTTGAASAAGFDPAHATMGITCEACHGPGAKHSELMDGEKNSEGRAAIFDPSRLSAIASVDFCGACHRTLNDVYEMGITGVANVRFQPYRLENSECWKDGDARLTCTACHNPHQPLVHDAAAYDEKCLACHVKAGEKTTSERPGKACPQSPRNCTTCHMPRVNLPSMHAPFVDHRIRIVRSESSYPD